MRDQEVEAVAVLTDLCLAGVGPWAAVSVTPHLFDSVNVTQTAAESHKQVSCFSHFVPNQLKLFFQGK